METLFAQSKEINMARISQHRTEQKQEKQEKLLKGTAAKSRDLIYVVAIPVTQTSTLSRDEHFYAENRAAM